MKTLILGAGRSGYGAAKLLRLQGRVCIVSDLKSPAAKLSEQFKQLGVDVIVGPQNEELLKQISQIVISPGVSPKIPIVTAARLENIAVISEIELALSTYSRPWIGITGTNGKSTCTHWLYQLLSSLKYQVAELGNIGTSPSEVLADHDNFDFLAVELSSYQIEGSPGIAPKISFFTSFSPDHLERHGKLENYFAAKWQLILQTPADGYALISQDVWDYAQKFEAKRPWCQLIVVRSASRTETLMEDGTWYLNIDNNCLHFADSKLELDPKGFPYAHEVQNIAMCLLASHLLTGCSWTDLLSSLDNLTRLPYRFEVIGQWMGKPVINDSKSTNVESALVALKSLNQNCYLILGGQAKDESFTPIMKQSSQLVEVLVYGASSQKICQDLEGLPISCHNNLNNAVQHLKHAIKQRPAAVLFSPACASFDGFENFEARGLYFNQSVASFLSDP